MVPHKDRRINQDFIPGQLEWRPKPHKEYSSSTPTVPLTDACDILQNLLTRALGVRQDSEGKYRTASSAGNRHPVEAYVHTDGGFGMDSGVWHFDPTARSLQYISDSSSAHGTAIILTGVPWRTCWKYAERGYRHLWWDAGTVLAHLDVIAREGGLDATVSIGFPDAETMELVGVQGQDEYALAIFTLDPHYAVRHAGTTVAHGNVGPSHAEFPLVSAVHHASDHSARQSEAWRDTAGMSITTPVDSADALTGSIDFRRSTRSFSNMPIGREELADLLRIAVRPPAWDGGSCALPIAYAFVRAVHGVPAGRYLWAQGRLTLQASSYEIERVQQICLGQRWASDAAVILIYAADLTSVVRSRGERGYRAVHLAAGIALGRTYLAATRLGLGCCGLTVHDELFCAATNDVHNSLVACAVGVPASAALSPGPLHADAGQATIEICDQIPLVFQAEIYANKCSFRVSFHH
jgi:SagB-type dehydrogenase family enzyme